MFAPCFGVFENSDRLFCVRRQTVQKKTVLPLNDSWGVAFEFKVEHMSKHFTLDKFEEEASGRRNVFADESKDANRIFWEHVCRTNSCAFLYGSDLTGTACSEDAGKWNLEKFSNDSLLGMIRSSGDPDICGVNLPMLYVGHAFSMFGWHIEDNALYSLNYMHKGSAKTWYGVPGHEAQKLEKLAKSLFEQKDDLSCRLYQKLSMISPNLLLDAGIPVYELVQRPGEFVITMPRSYHSGFSHGFNVGEAVNFALPEWIPYGFSSLESHRGIGRESVLNLEKFLFNDSSFFNVSVYSAQALVTLIRWQQAVIKVAEERGVKIQRITRSSRGSPEQSDRVDKRVMCCYCKHSMYLMYLYVPGGDGIRFCPDHANHMEVEVECLSLYIRFTKEELANMEELCQAVLSDPTQHKDLVGFQGEILVHFDMAQPIISDKPKKSSKTQSTLFEFPSSPFYNMQTSQS
mmetsp:Transcript_2339/g.7105  ORF Transcript_2339/g.7105 Transcript_2339/m.7105 type:complete len:460 (+) Transcript_2339:156-1535(+)